MDYAFMEEHISDEPVTDAGDVAPQEDILGTNKIAEIDAEMSAIYRRQVYALHLFAQCTRAQSVLQRYGDTDVLREMLGTSCDRSIVSTESFVMGLEGIIGRILGQIWNTITAKIRVMFMTVSAVVSVIFGAKNSLEMMYKLYPKIDLYSDDILSIKLFVIDPPEVRKAKIDAIRACAKAAPDAIAALKNSSNSDIPKSVLSAIESLSALNFIKFGDNYEIDWSSAFRMLKKHWDSSELTVLSASGYGDTWDKCRKVLCDEIKAVLDTAESLQNPQIINELKKLEADSSQNAVPTSDKQIDEATAQKLIAKTNACTAVIEGGSRVWSWFAWWDVFAVGLKLFTELGHLDSIGTFILKQVMTVLRALGRALKSVIS